jgi:hypothetical protein
MTELIKRLESATFLGVRVVPIQGMSDDQFALLSYDSGDPKGDTEAAVIAHKKADGTWFVSECLTGPDARAALLKALKAKEEV